MPGRVDGLDECRELFQVLLVQWIRGPQGQADAMSYQWDVTIQPLESALAQTAEPHEVLGNDFKKVEAGERSAGENVLEMRRAQSYPKTKSRVILRGFHPARLCPPLQTIHFEWLYELTIVAVIAAVVSTVVAVVSTGAFAVTFAVAVVVG